MHSVKKEAESSKAIKTGPLPGLGKAAWCPVEVSRTVLWPENVNVSVVRCMELSEAPVESEEEEEEEEVVKGDLSTLPENSAGGFQASQADIMARLTENLFLDLLQAEDGGIGQSSLVESDFPLPSENGQASAPWACLPMGSKESSCQATGQPSHPAHGAADLACTQVPLVVSDNPAYRSFSDFCSPTPSPEQQQSGQLEEGDPPSPVDSHSSGPPTEQVASWEQILHLSVLQHGAAGPTPASTSGYREFVQAVKQGTTRDPGVPSGDTGYKAFSSLLNGNGVCTHTAEPGPDGEHGGYKPFQSPVPNQSPSSMPLVTFGLDMELPPSSLNSALPSSTPECLGLELGLKGHDRLKVPPPAEQVPKPFGDDLGLGIVYSSLTCHLCGHLKQHHSQEEGGQIHVIASPCCGCCLDDKLPSLGSLSGALESCPGEMPSEASLTLAPKTPLNLSGKGKTPGHSVSNQPSEVSAGTPGTVVS